jgi:hypothetical protein
MAVARTHCVTDSSDGQAEAGRQTDAERHFLGLYALAPSGATFSNVMALGALSTPDSAKGVMTVSLRRSCRAFNFGFTKMV